MVQGVQLLERDQVGSDVLADRGVRAAAGLDRADAVVRQGVVAHEELAVLAGEDVVGHRRQRQRFAQAAAQLQHQCSLARADWTADADGEGAVGVVARQGCVAVVVVAGVVEVLVGMLVVVHHCPWFMR